MKNLFSLLFGLVIISPTFAQHEFYLELNGGNPISNEPEIGVDLVHVRAHDKAHMQMRFSTSKDFSGAKWLEYKKKTSYEVKKEGNFTIYAQLKDSEGALSKVASSKISLDFTPPQNPIISIEEGNEYTNNKSGKVDIRLSAEGADKMQLSNEDSFQHGSKWQEYNTSSLWKLAQPHKDGLKKVYARFKDKAGNISKVVSSQINLDTKAPKGSIVINNGDEYTFSQLVYLTLNTEDEDIYEVRIVGPKSQVFKYQKGTGDKGPNSMLQVWWLDSIEGRKVVKAWFKDKAGNVSETPTSFLDDIILSLDHPDAPKVTINSGDKFCTNEEGLVTVSIASDENGRYEMMVSNSPDFAGAEKMGFQPVINSWKLNTNKDGKKRVFVKVFSKSGSSSETGSDEILLYSKKPKPIGVKINKGKEWTNKALVRVDVKAENAQLFQLSNNPGFTSARDWKKIGKPVSWRITEQIGENIVYVRFKDLAGNISETIEGKINYDTELPDGSISLSNNSLTTNKSLVKLNLKYSEDVTELMLSNDVSFTGSKWEKIIDTRPWKLSDKPGKKAIYYRFKDRAGNMSPPKRLLLELIASN